MTGVQTCALPISPERGAQDHCVRAHDLTFFIKTGKGEQNFSGGSSAIGKILDRDGGLQTVMECSVLAASSKGKEVMKPKVIGRRSVEEEQFLENILLFMRVLGSDRLFTLYTDERKVELTGKMVRAALKADRKSTRLNSSHLDLSRMPSSA